MFVSTLPHKAAYRSPFPGTLLLAMLMLYFCCIAAIATQAQTIADADFETGDAGWDQAGVEVMPLSVFGSDAGGHVAVVDGDAETGHGLRQTIGGFTPGATYKLHFDAARWMPAVTPALVSAEILMNGVPFTVVTRMGNVEMLREELRFTAITSTIELEIRAGFTGSGAMLFDDFGLAPVNMLPVQLDHYAAWPDVDAVVVDWVTATENNNAYFEVERSTDLVEWTSIGTVPAMGNSQTPLAYHLRDTDPEEGANYYHLKQVDRDGNVAVSGALAVYFQGSVQAIKLWPDPAVEQVRVQLDVDRGGQLRIVDTNGREVPVQQQREGNVRVMQVADLPEGVYLVQDTAEGRLLGRFIKQ